MEGVELELDAPRLDTAGRGNSPVCVGSAKIGGVNIGGFRSCCGRIKDCDAGADAERVRGEEVSAGAEAATGVCRAGAVRAGAVRAGAVDEAVGVDLSMVL